MSTKFRNLSNAKKLAVIVRSLPKPKTVMKFTLYFLLGLFLYFYYEFGIFSILVSLETVYLLTGGWRFMRVLYKTFPRDAAAGAYLIKAKLLMKRYEQDGENIPSLFKKTAADNPNKTCFIDAESGRQMTFQEVDDFSNRVANFFLSKGYNKGDAIALFMESRPEYPCLWLGMAKIGIIPALINFNLRMDAMVHCVNAAKAKTIVVSADLMPAMIEAKHLLPSDVAIYCYGVCDQMAVVNAVHLEPQIEKQSSVQPQPPAMGFNDRIFYIYTSGTTGLPKAAKVIHSRFFYMASSTHHFFKMDGNDVVYDTLPLYHTAGGVLGIGQAFLKGCTVVIRKKFSASRFWDDCIKYNATAAQYIGEICRYLLAQPPKAVDSQHKVKMAFGNGLRPQIWKEFTSRFNIGRIGEFYGATEGNANIINTDNTVGAVGFLTRIAPAAYPVTLIKVDEDTGTPVRDRNGMCVRCEPYEPGEMVGRIIKGDPLREFDGYANAEATAKKICHDVFKKGDKVFLTGDILEMDEFGYVFFRDRTGDTFRWRGENVSTSEVEATISNIVNLLDATVYGVEIPGTEGRAGMAAIVDDGSLDLKHLADELQRALPLYARPVFIRTVKDVDTTGTFKLKKTDYRKQGFDPANLKKGEKCYYLDSKAGMYLPLSEASFNDIKTGKMRF